MRIWLAPSAFFPHRGGVEELTLQLSKALQSHGHEVLVVAPRHPIELPVRERIEGVDVARVAFSAPRRSIGSLLGYPRSLASQLWALRALGPVPDLVHIQCPSVQLPAVTLFSALSRRPLVLTTQGEVEMDAANLYGQSTFMRAALRAGARRAAALTACSAWAAAKAAVIAAPFAAATVVPNGVDPGQWQVGAPVADPVFAAWGRLVPQKGFDLLLDAFGEVRAALPAARLLLGGDGPMRKALQAGAPPGVEFLGPLDRAGVQAMLDRSRVVVVPSRLEPFGIVAVEAMATGRPVVRSNVGGLDDATGGMGPAVDPTDRAALVAAMIATTTAPPDPAAARRHAETLSWEHIAVAYDSIYFAVTGRPRYRPQPAGAIR